MELIDRLSSKLGSSVLRGNEYLFKECPFCHNDRQNFQINLVYGVWHCWSCNKGGKVLTLLKLLGIFDIKELGQVGLIEKEKWYLNLEEWLPLSVVENVDKRCWFNYFRNKHLTIADLENWGIRIKGEDLLFPFFRDGSIIYWVIRRMALDKNYWMQPKGWSKSEECLYRINSIYDKRLIIVEGIVDGIKVFKCGYNVLILCGTVLHEVDKQFIFRNNMQPILCLDSDVKEYKYEEFKKHLGLYKVVDIFQYDDPSDIQEKELIEKIERAENYVLGIRLRKKFNK